MSNSYKYNAQKILELTNGGLDAILLLYPEADKKGGRWQKVILNFENENTASSQIIPKTVGTETVFLKSFSSNRSFNCFELVMEEHSLEFYEACKWIAQSLSLDMGDNSNFGQGGFEMIEAVEGQNDGDYIFDYHKELTKFERETLGPLVTNEHCNKFNLKSCKHFIQIKHYPTDLKEHRSQKTHKYAGKTMQIITKSSDTYPILVFDFGTWQKVYQPLNQDKSFRFRYVGKKPENFVFGLELLEDQFKFNEKQVKKKIADAEKNDVKLEEKDLDPRVENVIIGSGDRDSINIFSMGFHTVWLNSETADLEYKVKEKLFKYAKNVSYCGDIDATGVEQTIELAKKYIDIKIIWLPRILKDFKYRGNPRKDVKDFMDIFHKENDPESVKKYFTRLVYNALPAKFWYEYKSNKGKKYDVSNEALMYFLQYQGFYRYKPDFFTKNEYEYIRVENNIIYEADETTVSNFPIEWLRSKLYPIGLIDSMHRTAQLSKDKLKRLNLFEPNYTHTGKNFQYQFFKNKIWKITPGDIEQLNYGKADVNVQESKIVDKDALIQKNKFFEIFTNKDGEIDIKILRNDNDFFNFFINTSRLHWSENGKYPFQLKIRELEKEFTGDALKAEIKKVMEEMAAYRMKHQFQIEEPSLTPEQNYEQRRSLINKIYAYGYMLHRYKKASRSFSPFVMDDKISVDADSASGGSGKSIIFTKALSKAVGYENVVEINGKKADFEKDKFLFDNVKKHSHAILINDIKQRANIETLYNLITDSFSVEPKGKAKYTIQSEDSPKICVSSNYGVPDMEKSGSTMRRLLPVPFSDYYHTHTNEDLDSWEPKDDFGKDFFQDWDDKEWNDFFNLNAQCLQFSMKHDKPVKAISENITKRNLQTDMGFFQTWAGQYFTIEKLNSFIPTNDIKEAYNRENSKLSSQKLFHKIETYAKFKGFKYNPIEFRSPGGYIIKNINGVATVCLYIKKIEKPASEIVKEMRFDLRLSQKDFAIALGIAQSQVSRVELGKHDIGYNKLQSWCKILRVSLTKYL